MDNLCYLCLVVMLSRLLIAALWSPVWKGLTSWLSCVLFGCVFVTFPGGILGQVWYLIVSIPDLCHVSYFVANMKGAKSRMIYSSFTIFASRERSGLLAW